MRIVIDLQGAQCESRHRGIGRYSMALARAMVKNRGEHEIIIVLNGLFKETIEPIRAAFDQILPQENILVWQAPGPVHAFDEANNWRRKVAELIRESFLASLRPDVLHITSLIEGFSDDAVHSIGELINGIPTAVTFYDLIPLIQSDVYLEPNPLFARLYKEKIGYLKQAHLYLAISESSRQESVKYLLASEENSMNIGAAVDACFQPIYIAEQVRDILFRKFGIKRPFLMYSGATDERKNHIRLIKAFALLPVDLRDRHQLVIAGYLPDSHRKKFENLASLVGLKRDEFIITGRVSDREMVQLYNLCALFVFPSWHEGFGLPALEAMACGAPVLASNNSSLPEVIGRDDALFNPFSEQDISEKIQRALSDSEFCEDLRRHGLKQAKKFSWDITAKNAIDAFERLHRQTSDLRSQETDLVDPNAIGAQLVEAISQVCNPPAEEGDWIKASWAIAQNHPSKRPKQLLVDISELVHRDSRTGIQRVVRSVLLELFGNPTPGYKVEPVYGSPDGSGYRYARTFARTFAPEQYASHTDSDDPVDYAIGDVFLGLDLQHHIVQQSSTYYSELKRQGIQVFFVIYDLLPVLMPQFFREGLDVDHAKWLSVLADADGVVGISRAVADEMLEWLVVSGPERLRPLKVGWFHLGADVAASQPSRGLPKGAEEVLVAQAQRPSFLMVGTLEPRKGQLQTLAAFDLLWRSGVDANLVLVGKHGWNVDLLVDMMRTHGELGKRLFWLEGISDEFLEKVYESSTCLIAASEGEGFGLPLIEAAQHKKPIIARAIPVFLEVAGKHVHYFSGLKPEDLANAVRDWLVLNEIGQAPKSGNMPWLTWKESTQSLLDVIFDGKWYQEWMPDDVHRFWGGDHRFSTQVGKRTGREIVTTGAAGYLIYGPYVSLDAGHYQVLVRGVLEDSGTSAPLLDIAVQQGSLIIAATMLDPSSTDGVIAKLSMALNMPCIDLEVRILVSDGCALSVSMIEIAPQVGVSN